MKIFILILILSLIISIVFFIYAKYFKEKSIFEEPKLPMPLYKK